MERVLLRPLYFHLDITDLDAVKMIYLKHTPTHLYLLHLNVKDVNWQNNWINRILQTRNEVIMDMCNASHLS